MQVELKVLHVLELSNVSWTWALIMNTLLVSIFALQHSLLAMKPVKDLFKEYGLRDIERSIYIITTSLALEVNRYNLKGLIINLIYLLVVANQKLALHS